MPSDAELEATQLAQIEANLAELSTHINTWIQDRFLATETATGLNIDDVAGLLAWLQQWQGHFESFRDSATALEEAGRPALAVRLAQIRAEVDTSIATFGEMAASLTQDQ